jgi:hypothetical protein
MSADADVRNGSIASVSPDHGDFRSTPVNGHSQDRRACLKVPMAEIFAVSEQTIML